MDRLSQNGFSPSPRHHDGTGKKIQQFRVAILVFVLFIKREMHVFTGCTVISRQTSTVATFFPCLDKVFLSHLLLCTHKHKMKILSTTWTATCAHCDLVSNQISLRVSALCTYSAKVEQKESLDLLACCSWPVDKAGKIRTWKHQD